MVIGSSPIGLKCVCTSKKSLARKKSPYFLIVYKNYELYKLRKDLESKGFKKGFSFSPKKFIGFIIQR